MLWEKTYELEENIDYHLQLAGALSLFTDIADEKQNFTYDWGTTRSIDSNGDIKRVPRSA